MESKLRAMASKRPTIVHQPQALQPGFLHSPRKKPKNLPQPHELASKGVNKVSCYTAKDLRIKRVFSPNLETPSSVPSGEQNRTRPDEDSGVCKSSETAEVRYEISCKNSNGCVEFGDENRRSDWKSENLVHSTPPDAEVLAGVFVAASSIGCPRSSNGSVLVGDTHAKSDCRIDSLTRSGSVLKPCSKRKLFKAPGSIAYKRLLPFLLDSDNYTLHGDSCSKLVNNLEKKANIESNPCSRAKESSFVDSNTSVTSTFKQNLRCPDNRVAENFQNVNVSRNDLTLVKEDYGLKKDNAVCASSLDKRQQIAHCSTKEQSKTDGMERLDGGNSYMSSNISSEAGNFKSHVSEKLYNNSPVVNKREDHFDDKLKMPSLDSNLACNHVKEETMDEKLECTLGGNQNLSSSIVGENHCNIATEGDKKYDLCVRNKMVRNPLVQLKSKYSQVSVSYRRMLPFLEELFKDNSENCPSENIHYEKELPTMNVQLLSTNSHTSQDNPEGIISCNMPCDGNSDTLSMPVLNTMNETACETENVLVPAEVNDTLSMPVLNTMNETACETANVLVPAEVNDTLQSPPKLQLLSEQVMLDESKLITNTQLDVASLLNDRAVSSLHPAASYEPLTGEGPRVISERLLITSEECASLTDNISDGAKLSDIYKLESTFSCIEARIPPDSRINVGKGILKRNPRGCRGICNCLNCASFRLHAERAFEFSKNQLQDAEEVASDLMKELSFLRDVLEKCSNGAKEEAGYHSLKAKDACRKAFEAELVAKDRLLRMNYELGIHSRITCSQRPNVRFSSEVEKREIEDGK